MIVYRDNKRTENPRDLLAAWNPSANLLDALIELGEIEAGLADAGCDILRPVMVAAARAYLTNTRYSSPLPQTNLPDEIEISTPEGFAWYALDPRQYAEAALRFFHEKKPKTAAVIGIRSIGTTLSAIVAAALDLAGCPTHSSTVRPQGHPFDRQLSFSEPPAPADWYLIVDEGPGLSGSSFASVARALTDAGISSARIVFLPAWDADGSTFLNAEARQTWQTHERFVQHGPARTKDISAGNWRPLLYANPADWPAVQPQHERRKYLCDSRLHKFAGFGKYGRAKYDRARALAPFTPAPLALDEGYLITGFIPGRPLTAQDAPALLPRLRDYLHALPNLFPARAPTPLAHMMRINIEESLGPEWLRRAESLISSPPASRPTQIDARMFPHEWIETAEGFLKTDALDHHDDHFFPGCQDILWDVAMTAIEFDLPPEQALSLSPGKPGPQALKFYRTAYLAFRLGYCSMAASAIPNTPDAARFQLRFTRYAALLRQELSNG